MSFNLITTNSLTHKQQHVECLQIPCVYMWNDASGGHSRPVLLNIFLRNSPKESQWNCIQKIILLNKFTSGHDEYLHRNYKIFATEIWWNVVSGTEKWPWIVAICLKKVVINSTKEFMIHEDQDMQQLIYGVNISVHSVLS